MACSVLERQIESTVQNALDDKTLRIVRGLNKIASKQGGSSIIENYQLLGKRALIILGVTVVAVQLTTSAISFVMSRRSEEQRIERIVRRVLEEEQQKAKAD